MPTLSFRVLRLRDFRLLMFTRGLATFALQAQAIIVGWQVYSLTRDPYMLGLTGLAEAVPALSCALFAGHVVDISRPHRVLLVCMGVMALNSFALLLLAGGIVPTPAKMMLATLYGGVFISGIARSFMMPSSFTLLPQLVPRTDISAASAWMNSFFQLAAISGPAAAGIIYGGWGARTAWLLPVAFLGCAFVMLTGFGHGSREFRSRQAREPAVKSIRAGWGFILSHPVLLAVMALDMFAVLFGGAVAMLPAYADQVLHVGSEGLGALRSAPAIGAIASALILAVQPMKRVRGVTLMAAVTGFGLCMIGFGLSTVFWLSMAFLAGSGAFDSVSVVLRTTLLQLLTPDAMRGRVSAVGSMFIISSNEIGAYESGLAARLCGLVPSVALGGVGTLIVVAAIALICPQLRKVSIHQDEQKA